MAMSDTSSMIDGFAFALLTAEFGQVWAKLGRLRMGAMITYDLTPQQRLNPSAKRWMAEPADRL